MDESSKFPLVPKSPSAVAKQQPGAERILSGIVGDALALANGKREPKPTESSRLRLLRAAIELVAKAEEAPLAETKFRVGGYEWCEPDYRQILIWAKTLKLEPQQVIQRLLWRRDAQSPPSPMASEFNDGRIIKLTWNFDLLPIRDFQWVDDLEIVDFYASYSLPPSAQGIPVFYPILPKLRSLTCQGLNIAELDLSGVPMLTKLDCVQNNLTELELGAVPMLTHLCCTTNQLTALDLSSTPMLTNLHCGNNRLAHIDLSSVPRLMNLGCSGNKLVKLDLSAVPMLTELFCPANRLVDLNLSSVPLLKFLNCYNNKLTDLDIRPLQNLETLFYDEKSTRLVQRPGQIFKSEL